MNRVQFEGKSAASYYETKLTLFENSTPPQFRDLAVFYRAVIEGLLNMDVKDRALFRYHELSDAELRDTNNLKKIIVGLSNLMKSRISMGIIPASAGVGISCPAHICLDLIRPIFHTSEPTMELMLSSLLDSLVCPDRVDICPPTAQPGLLVCNHKLDMQCTRCSTATIGPVLNNLGSVHSPIARIPIIGQSAKACASGAWRRDTTRQSVLKRLLASQKPSMP